MHSCQNGTRCRNGVKVLCCHFHLVWLVTEGCIPTCACFYSANFCDLLILIFICFNFFIVGFLRMAIEKRGGQGKDV